jgi:hypothetical protein
MRRSIILTLTGLALAGLILGTAFGSPYPDVYFNPDNTVSSWRGRLPVKAKVVPQYDTSQTNYVPGSPGYHQLFLRAVGEYYRAHNHFRSRIWQAWAHHGTGYQTARVPAGSYIVRVAPDGRQTWIPARSDQRRRTARQEAAIRSKGGR